ncbi:mycofactocin precursor MftA [Arthrobacter yangruifuii]|uniref:Mycofactocin n=1 Tax=Arthrobacter yangruifuii TaxID=2606616 RepID=A0A5N6MHC3_9MICC|nr:mycofactocin precursor MftA [Arthrobacter yangruifuii]KAD3632987.1 mycofactocin precursor [Arthrobacter yangruifuii]
MRPGKDLFDTPPTDTAAPAETQQDAPEDLLVEEVSIDGMCGVY